MFCVNFTNSQFEKVPIPLLTHKVCTIENNTNLNSFLCILKSSKIDLPAFDLINVLMTSSKNFEKIAILKK